MQKELGSSAFAFPRSDQEAMLEKGTFAYPTGTVAV
jgi:hypothetical protein